MKRLFDRFRATTISGFILFLPIFFLVGIIQKLWNSLSGFSAKVAALIEFKIVTGIAATYMITTVLLILIFYFCGLLIRFAFIGKFKNWIEDNLLQYIPGYLTYKVKMEKKLIKKEAEWQPVLVKISGGFRPGLLVEVNYKLSTVYFPNCPDTNYGEVWVVESENIKKLKGDINSLLKSVQYSGKGLMEM